MTFDFGEIFSAEARMAAPLVRSRGLSLSFDCEPGHLLLPGDPSSLKGALHRLIDEVLSVLEGGTVLMAAEWEPMGAGQSHLTLRVGGVGHLAAGSAAEAAEHLGLRRVERPQDRAHTCLAVGSCPLTGGKVTWTWERDQGVVLTLEMACLGTSEVGDEELEELGDPDAASGPQAPANRREAEGAWDVSDGLHRLH